MAAPDGLDPVEAGIAQLNRRPQLAAIEAQLRARLSLVQHPLVKRGLVDQPIKPAAHLPQQKGEPLSGINPARGRRGRRRRPKATTLVTARARRLGEHPLELGPLWTALKELGDLSAQPPITLAQRVRGVPTRLRRCRSFGHLLQPQHRA